MSGASRVRGTPGDLDARVLAWLTAPEGASSRRVLDAAFADLASIPQEPLRPWTPLLDALSRPASVELPRWAWIAVVLLLLLAISIATLTVAGRLRPWLDRLSALPVAPAALAEVECPGAFAAAGEVRCRMATVPQRHELSSGPSVRVLVAEFPTSGAAALPGAEPLLTPISLDPSGERTIVDLAATARSLGRPVIGVAARGTGASEPSLGCPELESVATPADPAEMAGAAWRGTLADAVRGCRDRLTAAGIDVTAYGLAQQAADLESIRQALGVDRWMVRTFGDDSRLALELIRRYPDHVAGVVLVGPSFPGEDPAAGHGASGAGVDRGADGPVRRRPVLRRQVPAPGRRICRRDAWGGRLRRRPRGPLDARGVRDGRRPAVPPRPGGRGRHRLGVGPAGGAGLVPRVPARVLGGDRMDRRRGVLDRLSRPPASRLGPAGGDGERRVRRRGPRRRGSLGRDLQRVGRRRAG